MANNVGINLGSEATVATLQDASLIHHQKCLLEALNVSGDPTVVSPSTPLPAQDIAVNTGGSSAKHSRMLGSSGMDIGSGPGRLFGFDAYNTTASEIYLKFYNKAAGSVDPALDVPFLGPFLVPPVGGIDRNFMKGIQFPAQISVRATTGLLDTDAVSPSANTLIFNAEYK